MHRPTPLSGKCARATGRDPSGITRPRFVLESHRISERKLTVLALFHRNAEHRLEDRHQLALRWGDDRSRNLRLLPENLPVRFLRGLRAIELGLAGAALTARQQFSERDVKVTNTRGIRGIRALECRDLRHAQE